MQKISNIFLVRDGSELKICVNSSTVTDRGRCLPFHNGAFEVEVAFSSVEAATEVVSALGKEFSSELEYFKLGESKQSIKARHIHKIDVETFLRNYSPLGLRIIAIPD